MIAAGADGNLWFTDLGSTTKAIGRIGAGAAPALLAAPSVSGAGRAGSVESCQNAQWSSWAGVSPSTSLFSFDGYRWLLDGAPIAGQSPQSYTPTNADVGHQLACEITVTYPLPLLVTPASAASAAITVQAALPGGGGGGGGGGTSFPTRTLIAKTGNQLIALATSLTSACVARSGSLRARLSSSAIAGSKATKLRLAGAAFSIDRGVRHVHHRTRHRHGKKVVLTTITYTPNRTVRRLPANVSLKLAGLGSSLHTFKVKVSYHETVKRQGHNQTITVSKTLSLRFKVC